MTFGTESSKQDLATKVFVIRFSLRDTEIRCFSKTFLSFLTLFKEHFEIVNKIDATAFT